MNYYKLNDKILLNLNTIDHVRLINDNNIYSDHIYQIITGSGHQIDITKEEYNNLLLNLNNSSSLQNG